MNLLIISPPAPATLSLLGTDSFVCAVFSNNPSLCPALNEGYQVSLTNTKQQAQLFSTSYFLTINQRTKDSKPNGIKHSPSPTSS